MTFLIIIIIILITDNNDQVYLIDIDKVMNAKKKWTKQNYHYETIVFSV